MVVVERLSDGGVCGEAVCWWCLWRGCLMVVFVERLPVGGCCGDAV